MQATLEDIPADTVLAELKTDKNKLSVWKVETENDLNDAFIALCANCNSIATIDAVKIDEKDLEELVIEKEEGNTPTVGINGNHRNIVELNYKTLGDVIMSIVCGIQKNGYVRKTKGEMITLLTEAYFSNKLEFDKLESSVKEKILKTIGQK